ncbi:class I SAM-dependent DNA methyltransferase, partial [Ellagibacter isourolithinifaciens]|uniref:class I SAM-dependent DNA methyltransferase n=1 Tax=Ellagibacter isourolithinifaciens TaxID=2137581 RepID=UPI0023F2A468
MADIRKLEKELWEAADNLRANSKLTSQQYCMPVLGLIFLRYAWGRFKAADKAIHEERAKATGRPIPIESADYTKRGAMYLPEKARYDYLLNLPEGEKNLGKRVDEAMASIEAENKQLAGVLPNNYTELGDDLLAETLRIFNNPALDEDGDDIIGRIYEYFLGKFAPAVASDDGVFFTPKSLVRMIMNVIEPERGVMLDPACGSGGMFVSASDYVRDHGGNPAESMTYYGQEKVEYNAKLCLMNMAVHGMNGKIVSGDAANTFYHDAHSLDGKCDYVAANPPFNVDKVKADDAQSAGRMPLGLSGINKKGE